jgi:hypothetical protein
VVNNSSAQPKGGQPEIKLAVPLGVPAGAPAKVTLRGLRLDGVTEVRCHDPFARARLLGPAVAVNTPQADLAPGPGESQIEIELTVPADAAPESVLLTLVGPTGESKPHKLLVDDEPVTAEREPNNGFRQAQPLTLPATVAGAVQAPQDVDVFRFDGKAGQRVVAEVLAARLGSPLDATLTLYDAAGRTLAAADDSNGSADPILKYTLPRDGVYFLALIDAQDQGGQAHVYRLLVRAEK